MPNTPPATTSMTGNAAPVRLLFGGDTMLGRQVAQAMAVRGYAYPLAALGPFTRAADGLLLNLECAITSSRHHFRGPPKAFYFGAPPSAASCLREMNVGMVSLANNHVLDFDRAGLAQTLALLDAHGIGHCGAGANLAAARAPARMEVRGLRIGMAAFCDHQADFAAGPHRPGIAYLDLEDEDGALSVLAQARRELGEVDWPILSLHWGSNWSTQPSLRFRRLAGSALDLGWKILFGHSPHVFQGIAVARGCPLIYGLGDLVDDYAVDPYERNDHQVLLELELHGHELHAMRVLPLFIAECRVQVANELQARWIAQRLQERCADFGLAVNADNERAGWLRLGLA